MASSPYSVGGTVAPDVRLPDVYYRVNATPASFGGAVAQGTQELGQGAVKAGQFYGQIVTQRLQNQAQTEYDGLLHGVPGKMILQPDGSMAPDTGFLGKRGDDAANSYADFQKNIDAIAKKYSALAPSQGDQLEFDRWDQNYRKSYIERRAGDHYDQQFNSLAHGENEATAALSKSAIANNAFDDQEFERRKQDLRTAYVRRAHLDGAGPDGINAAVQKADEDALSERSAGVAQMVRTQLFVNGNVPAAQQLFKDFEFKIDPGSRIEIAKFLTPQVDKYQVSRLYNEGGYETGLKHPVPTFSPQVNAALDNAALRYGLDPGMFRTFAKIESGGNPGAQTGSYKGLLQLSNSEFAKHGGGNIFDPAANANAAAAKLAEEVRDFKRDFRRDPDATDLYMIHQQGAAGYTNHLAYPNRLAWENMAATAEGRQKGNGWSRAAIWGNIPDQDKARFGNVNNVTSEAFINLWRNRVANSGGGVERELTDDNTPLGFTMSKAEALQRAEELSAGLSAKRPRRSSSAGRAPLQPAASGDLRSALRTHIVCVPNNRRGGIRQ